VSTAAPVPVSIPAPAPAPAPANNVQALQAPNTGADVSFGMGLLLIIGGMAGLYQGRRRE
jgi:hypothetical protein